MWATVGDHVKCKLLRWGGNKEIQKSGSLRKLTGENIK